MPDDENPPTERTRAIRERIAVHTVEARRWGLALKVVVAAILVCAVAFLIVLGMRLVSGQATPG